LGPIFTIDARDNFFLEAAKSAFNLSSTQMYKEINASFMDLTKELSNKSVSYKNLKTALTPNLDKMEIVLVFDSTKIESVWYGYDVFEKIIPIFNKQSNHSILCGDYLGSNERQEELREIFEENINEINPYIFLNSTQFYLVYINNISNEMLSSFNKLLQNYNPYVGYFNLTYSSVLKAYLSTILVKSFVKHKNVIIMPNEEDLDNDEDNNTYGFPFEENDFICKSINSLLFDLFLSYKIEREVIEENRNDFLFSINAVSEDVYSIDDFKILIEDKKIQYLLDNKRGKLKKAALVDLKRKDLEVLILRKLNSNYIYNMVFLEEYNTIKFNIIIEFIASDTLEAVKMLISLEYIPNEKTLRLITMF
jgi:hypothetical protein